MEKIVYKKFSDTCKKLYLSLIHILSAMPDGNPYGMKATRILEINPSHPIFTALQNVYAQDKDAVKDYAQLLYDQALLIEGFPIDDPAEFSRKICEFMVKAAN